VLSVEIIDLPVSDLQAVIEKEFGGKQGKKEVPNIIKFNKINFPIQFVLQNQRIWV
jgi:hypothetical protein